MHSARRRLITRLPLWLGSLALPALVSSPARAQSWPAHNVRIVVPYPPGTGPDVMARLIAERLSKSLGQPFIVDNKPGANAIIGTDNVVKSPPDGLTLLLVDRLTLAVNPLLYKPLPYDPQRDLVAVSNVADVKLYLMVSGGSPVKTFKEFIDYAKSKPGQIPFGTGGAGSIMHLNMEALQLGTGISLNHVPFKAFAEVVPALVSDTVEASSGGVEAVQAFVREGKIRLLAVGSDKRVPVTPDVPTIAEAGGTSDMLMSTSYTLHARAGTPPELIETISAAVRKVLAEPDLVEQTGKRGLITYGTTPQELDGVLAADRQRLGKLISERNIHV